MFGGEGAPLAEVVEAAAAAGFGAVGVDLASLERAADVEGTSPAQVRALLDDLGLGCSDVVGLTPEPDQPARPSAARAAAVAADLGAPWLVTYVPRSMSWQLLVDRVAEAAETAAEHGVRLAVEFIPHSALTTMGAATDLCAAVGWERCGLVLDTVHVALSATSWELLSSLTGQQVALVQVSDLTSLLVPDLAAESRHRRLLPGHGVVELDRWPGLLDMIGFSGVVATEVLSDGLRQLSPALACELAMAGLAELWPG
jgi:sugar phosphate isomerase/epimerase